LAAAGYPEGSGFPQVILMHAPTDRDAQIALSMAQEWQETLGVEVDLREHSPNLDFPDNASPYIWQAQRCSDYPDAHNWLYEAFHPAEGNQADWLRLNPGDPQVGVYVQEFSELVQAAAEELDPIQRAELYYEAERILVYEIAAIVPIYHPGQIYVTKPYLKRNYPAFGGIEIERWRIEP
jgi:oligopeptide transport system substrate-binding protein